MWIDLEGLDNLRDLGGTPAGEGREIRPGRLWRSENHTGLPASALERLVELGLTDVVDLRSDFEVTASPSPLRQFRGVTYHQHSFFPDAADDDAGVLERALPWVGYRPDARTGDDVADTYLGFLAERPDSVLAALRAVADAPGAALVHCAVGKDRTGFTVAMALTLVGVAAEHVVDDYARTTERIVPVVRRLRSDRTYADDTPDPDEELSAEAMAARPEVMRAVLRHLDEQYGGGPAVLRELGWTDDDQARLERKLLDA